MDVKHNPTSTDTKRDSKFSDSSTVTAMPISTPNMARSAQAHGASVDTNIDPQDGKTRTCDRDHTFDMFLPQEKMPEEDKAKRMGHTWEVVRAIKRLRKLKLKKPLRKMSSRRRKGRASDDAVEREGLIGAKY